MKASLLLVVCLVCVHYVPNYGFIRLANIPKGIRHSRSLVSRATMLFCQVRESQMSVDELKAELDVRTVNYDDCFSKNELVERLVEYVVE